MPMATLVDPYDVLKQMSYDSNVLDFKQAIAMSVAMAQSQLEQDLDTTFERGNKVDEFLILNDYGGPNGRYARLRLSSAFSLDPVTVVMGPGRAWSDYGDLAAENWFREAERGFVTVTDTSMMTGKRVRVSYVAGFEQENNVFKDVPRWLQDACTYKAIHIFYATNPQNKPDGFTSADMDALNRMYWNQVGRRLRAPGSAMVPV